MKDIPVFTTENGVASLTLREIPYRGVAYIKIQSSLEPIALVKECVQFCTMCGAETVVATGHPALEKYPFRNAVIQRRRPLAGLPDTDAALFPVQEKTLKQWLEIYNEGMRHVANAAWMTEKDGIEMLQKGDGYFVHRGDTLLGIGRASYDKIGAIVAVQKGAGADVALALCHTLTESTAMLEVASNNDRAVRLYDRLGFVPTAEISRWYLVK
ncbi:MAG: hypothetical protein IJZ15_07110 [Oscillospiraceae bacterium]|nr:hypothetical protein [Oscillospiraceae bacterium]